MLYGISRLKIHARFDGIFIHQNECYISRELCWQEGIKKKLEYDIYFVDSYQTRKKNSIWDWLYERTKRIIIPNILNAF